MKTNVGLWIDHRRAVIVSVTDKAEKTIIREADAILILGPGEAKSELKTRLESEALGGCIAGIETADKLTERQLAAKVRKHFSQSGGL
jgi:hypothetical protein